jgi:hypothetical protein
MKVFWYPATEPEDDLYRGKVGPSFRGLKTYRSVRKCGVSGTRSWTR